MADKNNLKMKILRIVGCVLCAAVTIFGTFSGFWIALVGGSLGNGDFFESLTEQRFDYETDAQTINAEYAEHILKKIDSDFVADTYTYFGEQYGDVSSVLRSCIDSETVRQLTSVYLKGIHASIISGVPIATVKYPADKFIPLTDRIKPLVMEEEEKIRLDEISRGISEEKTTALSEAEVDEALADLRERLSGQVSVYINSFKSINFGKKKLDLVRIAYYQIFAKPTLNTAFSLSPAIPLAAAAAAAVGLWFLSGADDKLKKTYNAVAALWVGTAAYAIPMLMFGAYDLPGKLILGDSFFKLLILAVFKGMISRAVVLALVSLIPATLALIACLVLLMRRELRPAAQIKAEGENEKQGKQFIAEYEGKEDKKEDK